jgi:hypothetical protein
MRRIQVEGARVGPREADEPRARLQAIYVVYHLVPSRGVRGGHPVPLGIGQVGGGRSGVHQILPDRDSPTIQQGHPELAQKAAMTRLAAVPLGSST